MESIAANIGASLSSTKFITGLGMLIMNVAGRYISVTLSETQEDLLRFGIAREIIIFTMAWIATRELVTSILITAAFIILADYLFNDQSKMCIIPKKVIEKNKMIKARMGAKQRVTPAQEKQALDILQTAENQRRIEREVEFAASLPNRKLEGFSSF